MKKFLGIMAAGLMLTSCSIKAYEGTNREVNVSGEGIIYADADKVEFTFAVETKDKDPSKAVSRNAEKMTAVLESIKGCGIASEDITTQNFDLYRETKYVREEYIEGDYKCSNSIKISTKEITKAGSVVDAAVKSGATNFRNFNYICSNPEMAKKQARTLAVKNCYENANLIVGTSGNKLGKLLQISEDKSQVVGIINSTFAARASMDKADDDPSTPLQAGKIRYRVTMYAKYEIK